MANFEAIPSEILEVIFLQLEIRDLNALMRTCKLFHGYILANNQIWKKHYFGSDTDLFSGTGNQCLVVDWAGKVKNLKICQRNLSILLEGISPKCFKLQEIPDDLPDLDSALELGSLQDVIKSLRFVLKESDQTNKLTVKFYARKMLRIFTQKMLRKRILENEVFEYFEFSILFSQWFNFVDPVRSGELMRKIDAMESKIRGQIADSDSTERILDQLNQVLFSEVGPCPRNDYYNPANSFVDQVMMTRKCGIPVTLSILYHYLALKLGIRLEMVNFPNHFLLKLDQTFEVYIDPFDGGKRTTNADLRRQFPVNNLPETIASVSDPLDVFLRMCKNVYNASRDADGLEWMSTSALELTKALLDVDLRRNPNLRWRERQDIYLGLCQNYLNKGVNKEKIFKLLLELRDADERGLEGMTEGLYDHAVNQVNTIFEQIEGQRSNIEVKRREDGRNTVQYTVGMVMKHKVYDYKCVIYGWDSACKASQGWKIQMGIHRLALKDKQPFYNVLVEDISERYAAQENLTPLLGGLDEGGIPHSDVGKYFQSLDVERKYYRPNCELSEMYPDD